MTEQLKPTHSARRSQDNVGMLRQQSAASGSGECYFCLQVLFDELREQQSHRP
jgi:hypothetical protein